MKINKDRRQFLKQTLKIGGGICASTVLGKYLLYEKYPVTFGEEISAAERSKVIIARASNLFNDAGILKEKIVSGLVHNAVMQITQSASKEKAWQSLFKPTDIVGLKLNCLSGKKMSPHVKVVEAIIQGLKFAGVKEKNIIVFERYSRELETAGFPTQYRTEGIQCYGTDELPGNGYESEPQIAGSVGTCFSQIISRFCTAIVNVPVLKDHDLAGISAAMKNFFGVIHNPNKYHSNNCNPYIAELCTHPYISGKVRLTICDAILAQYNGGPGYKPKWTWNYHGIIVGRDPVALDRVCHTIVEEKRKEMRLPSLKQANREPAYISTASMLGLGVDDIKKIDIIHI